MPYTPFSNYFPDIVGHETRSITILNNSELPAGTYSLLEMYCDEPGCDCRRVFFAVVSSITKNIEAVIAYGWESPEFYIKWMGDNDPDIIKELIGPTLNLSSPQSRLAPAILKMVKNVVLQDQTYVQRLKTHYKMFRAKIEKKPNVIQLKNKKKHLKRIKKR